MSSASITTRTLSTLPGLRSTVSALGRNPFTLFHAAPQGHIYLLILLPLLTIAIPGSAQQNGDQHAIATFRHQAQNPIRDQQNPNQAQQDPIRHQRPDLIDTALMPFWKSTTMYHESVLMTAKPGELPEASLLFPADKILSVKNSGLNITYREGVDWEYADGRLRLLPNSRAISLSTQQLFPDSASKKTFRQQHGGFILFSEGNFFHQHQLAVSYTHAPDLWTGPVTPYQPKVFRELLRKLKRGSRSQAGSKLKILLYGDSIAEGYNGSKHTGTPPFLPGWGELVAEKLRRSYNTEIEFLNTAVAGMDSRWGLKNVQERVIDHHPDLVIIAFGMNDGTTDMVADTFKTNIRQIIDRVKANNPSAAFILVAPMLANPRSRFVGTQPEFLPALQELTGNRIALVDMTGTHTALLEHKSYQDLTGNHINHPNDFLIRWYAQQVLSLLIPPSRL